MASHNDEIVAEIFRLVDRVVAVGSEGDDVRVYVAPRVYAHLRGVYRVSALDEIAGFPLEVDHGFTGRHWARIMVINRNKFKFTGRLSDALKISPPSPPPPEQASYPSVSVIRRRCHAHR